MTPICVKCRKSMRCKKNEFMVKESDGQDRAVWSGDMYECPECGQQVVVGFGLPMMGDNAKIYADEATEFSHN